MAHQLLIKRIRNMANKTKRNSQELLEEILINPSILVEFEKTTANKKESEPAQNQEEEFKKIDSHNPPIDEFEKTITNEIETFSFRKLHMSENQKNTSKSRQWTLTLATLVILFFTFSLAILTGGEYLFRIVIIELSGIPLLLFIIWFPEIWDRSLFKKILIVFPAKVVIIFFPIAVISFLIAKSFFSISAKTQSPSSTRINSPMTLAQPNPGISKIKISNKYMVYVSNGLNKQQYDEIVEDAVNKFYNNIPAGLFFETANGLEYITGPTYDEKDENY